MLGGRFLRFVTRRANIEVRTAVLETDQTNSTAMATT
jgi:hypothetical protein